MDQIQKMDELFKIHLRPIQCDTHGQQEERGFGGKHWSGCPECNRIASVAKEKAAIEKEYDDYVKNSQIPLSYHHKTFGDWVASGSGQAKVISRLTSYVNQLAKPHDAPNLILYGVTGSGKTLLASIILGQVVRSAFRTDNRWFRFVSSGQYLAEIKETWSRNSNNYESNILNDYGNCAVLVLDELGVRDQSTGDQDLLMKLLDRRYTNQLPTIITTNLSGREGVEKMLGDRSYDRINERSIWAACNWGSYRKFSQQTEDL
jgi:DNA replication protein DnaC